MCQFKCFSKLCKQFFRVSFHFCERNFLIPIFSDCKSIFIDFSIEFHNFTRIFAFQHLKPSTKLPPSPRKTQNFRKNFNCLTQNTEVRLKQVFFQRQCTRTQQVIMPAVVENVQFTLHRHAEYILLLFHLHPNSEKTSPTHSVSQVTGTCRMISSHFSTRLKCLNFLNLCVFPFASLAAAQILSHLTLSHWKHDCQCLFFFSVVLVLLPGSSHLFTLFQFVNYRCCCVCRKNEN